MTDKVYKDTPYFKCWLCDTAYIAMLHLSIDHAGVIYLCHRCHKHLKEALDSFNEEVKT